MGLPPMPTMLARPPHEYYITKQPHTSSSNRISDLAFSFACTLQFVHFNVTASHLLGNGFVRRHFDVWFELAKNIALRLWNAKSSSNPGSKSPKSSGRNRLLSFCKSERVLQRFVFHTHSNWEREVDFCTVVVCQYFYICQMTHKLWLSEAVGKI